MKALVIIPARYGSVRLTGKPLADLGGKPMIQRVYENAKEAALAEEVVVATDDQRILDTVHSFGGKAVLTSPNHPCGTNRVAEVAARSSAKFVVNLQGDMPFFNPKMLDHLIQEFTNDREKPVMGTLVRPISSSEDLKNPSIVKVVVNLKGYALYFSRSPIPHARDLEGETSYFKHLGIYIFQTDFLKKFSQLEPTPLEKFEMLEQLRALEYGYSIKVVETKEDAVEINTAEDLQRAREQARDS